MGECIVGSKTVIDLSDGVRQLMESLGLVGAYDVKAEGSRSTGYVGKPGDGADVHLVVCLRPLDEALGD